MGEQAGGPRWMGGRMELDMQATNLIKGFLGLLKRKHICILT